ncbi:SDR family oxidoreductase [Opitutus sp. GAS368]|uniref:SDR family oxidoreductase n=1 Tax=Opitutus sp. GAS368 TaxID=1882749 RepID=UPI00087A09B5|nr:SDR family oxidoreductase [Opitutus sp. GAS368]SDS49595.1 NAD(P)-dependent dehydrogenase, short-chain alcohol dehydrogenase family [Opitutus sp. GAS368]
MKPSPAKTTPGFSLAGKIILLTGGAGLYGRGLASQVAEAGATLVLASRDVAALEKVAAEERTLGRTVHARPLDQSEESSILRLRDRLLAEFGRVDGLINNAVARPMKSADAPLADWEASMKTNATGLFAITRAFGDAMAARGSGSIVNIGSIQGMVGPDFPLYEGLNMHAIPDYFFHKAGMVNLTRYFAGLYGPQGVRVNCVSPGGFLSGQHPTFVERYSKATFLRRMADDRDLGGPVIFLLGDAARYVTGVNLPVDGGYTAH